MLPMTIPEARQIAHTLSDTSKMPCPSWGISAQFCVTGNKLKDIPGTVCSKCYACKGNYTTPSTKAAHAKRKAGLESLEWATAMITQIWANTRDYFRWFDSGDLQSKEHLFNIIYIASKLPHIKFWLPTQERKMVKGVTAPENLVIRISSVYFDKPQLIEGQLTSSVHSSEDTVPDYAHLCPSSKQGHKCMDCRACWDKSIRHIAYLRH